MTDTDPLAAVIRNVLRRGLYQIPGEKHPYDLAAELVTAKVHEHLEAEGWAPPCCADCGWENSYFAAKTELADHEDHWAKVRQLCDLIADQGIPLDIEQRLRTIVPEGPQP